MEHSQERTEQPGHDFFAVSSYHDPIDHHKASADTHESAQAKEEKPTIALGGQHARSCDKTTVSTTVLPHSVSSSYGNANGHHEICDTAEGEYEEEALGHHAAAVSSSFWQATDSLNICPAVKIAMLKVCQLI